VCLLGSPVALAEDATLPNGIRVLVRPVTGTDRVALVVVHPVGEAHDPDGRSGLGHLVEHLICVSATTATASREVNDFAARYADGSNAHTSWDYTVVAGVFPRDRLEGELADAAARMAGLRVEAGVLERERGRIADELGAMYETNAGLAIGNAARDLLFPLPPGRRRGGTLEGLAAIDVAAAQTRIDRFYRAEGTIVALGGAVEPSAALTLCRRALGSVPRGEGAPPALGYPASVRAPRRIDVELPLRDDHPRAACLAAPRPKERAYAPFLVAVTRLSIASRSCGCRVDFPPFEDGRALTISSRAGGAIALEDFLDGPGRAALAPERPVIPAEAEIAASWVLGNPASMTEYEAAFRGAMLELYKIDGADLRRRVAAVTPAELSAVRDLLLTNGAALASGVPPK
jgi:zinc protease